MISLKESWLVSKRLQVLPLPLLTVGPWLQSAVRSQRVGLRRLCGPSASLRLPPSSGGADCA